jgi:hypothetical protein
MSNPDTSSAEWIVEAPAEASGGNDQILPLADFGKVTFTSATATANGHTGEISDPNWQASQVQLGAGAGSAIPGDAVGGVVTPSDFAQASSAGATTSTLSGEQFTVTWDDGSSANQPAVAGYPPYGYGYDGGGYVLIG